MDLAARFAVNHHIIRQGLIQLETMRLVERKRNKGAVLREFTVEDAVRIYAVRKMLEVAATTDIVLPGSPEFLERRVEIQKRHDAGVKSGYLSAVFRTNTEFYRVFFSGCDPPYLSETVDLFAPRLHAIRSFSMTDSEHLSAARAEHWDIIEALRTAKRERLVALWRSHLTRSRQHYIDEYKKRFADWQTASLQQENDRDGQIAG